MGIRFTRRQNGYIVYHNRDLIGLVLQPPHDGTKWRFITQWGDLYEFSTAHDAKVWATDCILRDCA